MIYIHTVYICTYHYSVYIYIYRYYSFWSHHFRSHPLQEAVDIVLKFPNPSDAADALVKDRMAELQIWRVDRDLDIVIFLTTFIKDNTYLNVAILKLSLSLSFFLSLYIYTCTSSMYNYAHVDLYSTLQLRWIVTGGKIPMDTTGEMRVLQRVISGSFPSWTLK